MIDGELRPIVTEFVVEMLNDPRCEFILLDVRGGVSEWEAICPSSTWTSSGKRCGCTLNIVGGEYSVSI